jgi:site-specific DNA-cytosine methylase
MGCKELKKTKEFDIDNKYIFSFPAFASNQQHLEANYSDAKITYLDEVLLPDYTDGTNVWMDATKYKEHIKVSNIEATDLMLAVPPCAGLSMLNTGNRGADCAANRWMYETVKWNIAQGNKVLCLENAPGLVGAEGVRVLRVIRDILDFNGVGGEYKMHCTKTTTMNHGIPQKRDRTFLYIYKSDSFVPFKNIKNVLPKLEDFLKRPEATDTVNHDFLKSTWSNILTDYLNKNNLWEKARALVGDMQTMTITPLLFEIYNKDNTAFDEWPEIKYDIEKKQKKLDKDLGYWDAGAIIAKGKVNAIIAKNAFRIVHPKYNRYITVREMMDLMGYPDSFVLQGDINRNFNHICQSLPVKTGMDHIRWAQGIVNNDPRYVGENIVDHSIDVLLQNNMASDLENDLKIIQQGDNEFKSYKKVKRNKLKTFMD